MGGVELATKATGEQPELFRVTDKSVKAVGYSFVLACASTRQALEDDSAIPNECLSEEACDACRLIRLIPESPESPESPSQ